MSRAAIALGIVLCLARSSAMAGEVKKETDPASGWAVYTLAQGATVAKLVPAAGCNTYSIVAAGTEIFHKPPKLADLPGYRYGNPVIYPMPNRVRNAEFKFQGRTYRFEPNNGPNFLHGLVHSVPWEVTGVEEGPNYAAVTCAYKFAPGGKSHELFPFPHTVSLETRVKDGAVRWTYTVDNTAGRGPVPFGMCLHPYFLYQGSRADTFLTIPATHLMESVELLPTGKLLALDGTKYDARHPKSLEGFVVDDVWFGLRESQPALVDFRDKKLKIALEASDDFTHMVVYTPAGQPFFCVENQTCSTDAHNLFDQGLTKESHLLIVEPGKKLSGWIEYDVAKY
jgi:aldose 1-epimerase